MTQLLWILGSFHLSVTTLFFLVVLTFFGTLAQVDEGLYAAVERYFFSLYVIEPLFWRIAVPLPGGALLMSLLGVNLLIGGILRRTRPGILVTHIGIIVMLIAGGVRAQWATEGNMMLREGQTGSYYEDYYSWEVAVLVPPLPGMGADSHQEYLATLGNFKAVGDLDTVTLDHPDWPFTLELDRFLPHSTPVRGGSGAGPAVDGYGLRPLPYETTGEFNIPGCYLTVRGGDGEVLAQGLLWGAAPPSQPSGTPLPFGFVIGDDRFGVQLRRERHPVPFDVRLEDFHREMHPGINSPRSYRSDVTVIEDGLERPVRIQMNEPLRSEGFVFFQSSFRIDQFGEASIFAVVENPSDHWPLYSCIVIALGLVYHFCRILVRYIRREVQSA